MWSWMDPPFHRHHPQQRASSPTDAPLPLPPSWLRLTRRYSPPPPPPRGCSLCEVRSRALQLGVNPTCVPTYPPTHPPTYLPIDLPTYQLPTYLPTHPPTYLQTNLRSYLPNYLPTHPTYLPTYPSTNPPPCIPRVNPAVFAAAAAPAWLHPLRGKVGSVSTINQSINRYPQSATRAHERPHPSTTTRAANPASSVRTRVKGAQCA